MSEPVTLRPSLRERTAEEIRALLARKKMSATQLARLMGISQAYVWRRLSGETAFDLDDLEKIARILDVGVLDLLPPMRVVNPGTGTGLTTVPTLEPAERPHLPRGPKRAVPPASSRRPARITPFIAELMPDSPSAELLNARAA